MSTTKQLSPAVQFIISKYLMIKHYKRAELELKHNTDEYFFITNKTSSNKRAIDLLMKNKNSIDIDNLCKNTHPYAFKIINDYVKKEKFGCISWANINRNSCYNAIRLLKKYPNRILLNELKHNTHIWAVKKIRDNITKVSNEYLFTNPNAVKMLIRLRLKPDWNELSANPSKEATELLKNNEDNISLPCLINNSSDWAVRKVAENIDYYSNNADFENNNNYKSDYRAYVVYSNDTPSCHNTDININNNNNIEMYKVLGHIKLRKNISAHCPILYQLYNMDIFNNYVKKIIEDEVYNILQLANKSYKWDGIWYGIWYHYQKIQVCIFNIILKIIITQRNWQTKLKFKN